MRWATYIIRVEMSSSIHTIIPNTPVLVDMESVRPRLETVDCTDDSNFPLAVLFNHQPACHPTSLSFMQLHNSVNLLATGSILKYP